jgi:hypothetical protein
MIYKIFTFRIFELESEWDAVESTESVSSQKCRVSLQLRRIPRGGLALAASFEASADSPLLKIRAWINSGEDQLSFDFTKTPATLRAGIRAADPLRATDSQGYWSDLFPVRMAENQLHRISVACLVEIQNEWL